MTYSYLDTKRKYLNFPEKLQPSFSAPHTFSLAVKKFIPALSLSANMSYAVAAGRPYYDIRNVSTETISIYDRGTTITNQKVNLHFAYLFSMFKKGGIKDFSGVGFGLNNVFGSDQIYGYNLF